ncbi:RNA polymerase sigma factor [Pedobacter deserti]|uniref:RNA polymerase sigma factor n=1 Tax=Pedobacter deserti TaxID=2817382 RepID=UPI00210AA50D|nr:RNA polymerase sigma-70 factor [Pedobacter sp. SYSU D00382]
MAIEPLKNEKELIAEIASGNQRAFTELFEAYYAPIGEYVLKLTKSIDITEEIVQDTFVKIWLKRADLPAIGSFTNYLFILCRNRTMDHLRKEAKERAAKAELENMLLEEFAADGAEHALERYRELIDRAVDKLPAQAKRVYILSRRDRYKHDEIALQLGISPETVKKHIQYAVAFIKSELKSGTDLVILSVVLSPLVLN